MAGMPDRFPPGDDPRALFPWLSASRLEPSREQLRAAALLARVPLFSRVPPRRLTDIAQVAGRERFAAGEAIIRRGEPGSTLYVIVSGRVDVVLEGAGGRALAVAGLGPGEFFGELALFDQRPRAATVVAADDTEALSLHRAEIRQILRHYPEVAEAFLGTLCARLRTADDLLENLGRTAPPGTRSDGPESHQTQEASDPTAQTPDPPGGEPSEPPSPSPIEPTPNGQQRVRWWRRWMDWL
jgi:CRP-like cAMP-binding protein